MAIDIAEELNDTVGSKHGEKNILCDFLIFRSYNFFPMTNLFRYTVFLLGKQEDKSFFC